MLARSPLPDKANIYKCFSNVDISALVPRLFIDVSDTFVHLWPYTFPDLSPTLNYQPVLLDRAVISLNTLESVAVAMEESVVSGRNAALLLRNLWLH